jgi:hypothetical protein
VGEARGVGMRDHATHPFDGECTSDSWTDAAGRARNDSGLAL